MSRVIDEHRIYLADRHRLDAFRRAIHATVRPGDVVLDLASGTGILGFFACEAGASRVYGLEADGIAGLSRRLAHQNGFADRYQVIRELSTRAELPQRVDVVVTDQIGPLGFEAGLFEVLSDARRRLLKRGGRVIPAALRIYATPFMSAEIQDAVAFWKNRPAGFDFTPAAEIAANTGYPVAIENPDARLAEPARISTWKMPPPDGVSDIGGKASVTAVRPGSIDAIAGWFSATLAEGIEISNSPLDPRRINRRAVMLPVHPPIPVDIGDRIEIALAILFTQTLVSWRIAVHPASGAPMQKSSGSTFAGMLISSEDVSRTRADATPSLSRAGEARRLTLDLVDGEHTVAEIEHAVRRSFPDLFAESESAIAFVAEVLSRYAR